MIAALVLSALMSVSGPDSDPPAAMLAGDEAFYRIAYPEAVSFYEAALRDRPDEPGILWRLARVFVCMGEATEEEADRKPLLKQAESCARLCIEKSPATSEGHTWLAGALGFLALDAGMKEQVRFSEELLAEADRALALNPEDDIALGIKGSFFRALGNVGWLKRKLAGLFVGSIPQGGFEEAEAYLTRAVALAPDVMRHRYELGVLYMDLQRNVEAEKTLREAFALPVRIASDRPRKEKILELLAELENRSE